jgi:dGTP triphosphohydrolase
MSVSLVKNRNFALEEVFDIPHENNEKQLVEVNSNNNVVKLEDQKQEEEDFQQARKTQKNLLSIAEQALEALLDLAQSSDSPRAYEVLSKMLKDTSDIAIALNNLKKIRTETVINNNETQNTQNNFFVGSTAELQKLIKEIKDIDKE